jgi:hypothetical protein
MKIFTFLGYFRKIAAKAAKNVIEDLIFAGNERKYKV